VTIADKATNRDNPGATHTDKGADPKSERGKGGGILGRGEGIGRAKVTGRDKGLGEEVMKRRLRRQILAELFDEDEDEEPGERLLRLALGRRAISRLMEDDEDDESTHRLLRLAIGRRAMHRRMEDDDWEPSGRMLRLAIGRRALSQLMDDDEDPIDRIVHRRLRRRVLSEIFEGGPLERIRQRREVARALWADFTPKTDIFEQGGMLVIRAELPGMRREDVEITVDDGDLVIAGERTDDFTVDDDHYYQEETTHGEFYRRIPLPEAAKLEQIKAAVKDGILDIRVPMPEQPKVTLT
jgi:HSP20 family molecular chaperone IbpA